LKVFPNVLILTTSNITEAIDLAFLDRADIKQYIGLPNAEGRYEILRSCLQELVRAGIIKGSAPSDSKTTTPVVIPSWKARGQNMTSTLQQFVQLATQSQGLSGRSLRKLPFQAHAFHVRKASCTLTEFIYALSKTVSERDDTGLQQS
jgi:SpoVK/Ycf46/Vps4 family AAA+-type ATPase